MSYNYPESIYLEATVAGYALSAIYSFQIGFATAEDASIAKVIQPGTISSLATTTTLKEPVVGFTIADAGTDGFATKIKQISIRNTKCRFNC